MSDPDDPIEEAEAEDDGDRSAVDRDDPQWAEKVHTPLSMFSFPENPAPWEIPVGDDDEPEDEGG